jgi:hypothetical protein
MRSFSIASTQKRRITMNMNCFIEFELTHLENVLARPLGKPFDTAYWRTRLGPLIDAAVVKDHRIRLERLQSRLSDVEQLALAA